MVKNIYTLNYLFHTDILNREDIKVDLLFSKLSMKESKDGLKKGWEAAYYNRKNMGFVFIDFNSFNAYLMRYPLS